MANATVTLKGSDGAEFQLPTGLFINNEFVPSVDGLTLDVENPATGETLATIAAASANDIDKAVAAAQAALPGWRAVLPLEKSKLMWKLAELLEKPENRKELVAIKDLDAGVPEVLANGNVNMCSSVLRYFAGWTDKIGGRVTTIPGGTAHTLQEPIGVCASIVAWNFPFLLSVFKLAPALATGNVIILKTPELAPLSGLKLAQLTREAGFPPGVVNVVTGEGRVTGQAIAEHMAIHKLSFTGGGVTARKIMATAAASNLKRVTFELGGKGPSIVFDDAQLENAAQWAFLGFTSHNGQVCFAGTRLYIQEGIYDRFLEAFKAKLLEAAEAPVSAKTPVISKLQRDKILSYIEAGKQEGGTILGGGKTVGDKGYYIQPTAFVDVKPDAKIMREEIFGPVVAISKFKTEAEVIAAANDSSYGLNAAVFSSDSERIQRVSAALEVGTVTVNFWGLLHETTAFGGVKESGFGRELGQEALEAWTQTKTVKQLFVSK